MSWNKRLPQLFRLGVSIVLIFTLWRLGGQSDLVSAVKRADLLLVGLVCVMANMDRLLMALKWMLLLKAKGLYLSVSSVIGVYYRASFLGSLLLPTVGADALRIYEVSKHTRQTVDVASSVVIERIIGLAAGVAAGGIGFILFMYYIDQTAWRMVLYLLLIIGGGFVLLCISFRLGKMGVYFEHLPIAKWSMFRIFGRFYESYQDYRHYTRVQVFFFLLSLLEQFEPAISAFLISQALDLDIHFINFIMFVPIIMLIIRLPVSFDGFGVREGLYVYFFGLVGVSQADAFLVGFCTSIVGRIAVLPPTLFFFLLQNDSASSPIRVTEQQ